MLSKKAFNEGLKRLGIEYKGFETNEERSEQWYEYLKNFNEKDFLNGIDECVYTCNHVPYMADVYKAIASITDKKQKWTDE